MGSPTVLLAGCAALPRGDGDEDVLLAALANLGCTADWVVWGEPRAREADLVILRATWDYDSRRDEFLDWCESVPRLRNDAAVARWNTDKTYLLDMQARGVAIVPTVLAEPGEQVEWPDTEFVIKPTVGAGSRGAQRFPAGTTRHADEHLAALHARGTGALIQPYQSTVDRHGETAVVFIAGELSHTYVKGPLLVPGSWLDSSGLFATETLMPVEASPEVLRFADKALDVAADVLSMDRAEFLYARVDVVRSDAGEPLLLELELTEPSLGLAFGGRQAADRLAKAAREIALS